MNITKLHLDPVGGVAGDMFVAALLDLRPDLTDQCTSAIELLGLSNKGKIDLQPYNDKILQGMRFGVSENSPDSGNGHVLWSSIRMSLMNSELPKKVKKVAIGIFELLASAEAKVHGIDQDNVTFHEVGAFDSIVDIIFSSVIIADLDKCSWSIGAIPRGAGLIRSRHGYLPLPAPATTILLQGFLLMEDEEKGERVTPTGAAIIRYLNPSQDPNTTPHTLVGAGIGFGSRKLKNRSNILRVTAYEKRKESSREDVVDVLRCEIDDQTAEDLALAIDVLREHEGVIDICQWPVFGKKGRLATAIQVLVKPEYTTQVSEKLFDETTTLGIRYMRNKRKLIPRKRVEVEGAKVKLANRPTGVSAKIEIDDLRRAKGQIERSKRRKKLEMKAIKERDFDAK